MRILITSTTYSPATNGQAVFTKNLAEGLAKRGHEVVAIIPANEGHAAYTKQRNGVRVEGLRSFGFDLIKVEAYHSLFSGAAIKRIMDDFQPQVVHIQDHYPLSREVLSAAKQRHIKLVGTNHFMPENIAAFVPGLSSIKPLYQWIAWGWVLSAYNQMDVVTVQSRVSAEIIRSHGLKVPVFPVSCGLDLNRFHLDPTIDRRACRQHYGIDPDKIVILFVGRVDKEKRVDVLLNAMARLKRDDIQLVVAGQGTWLNHYQKLANKLQLGSRVKFTGFVPDLNALLNSVDIFSMPSEAELLSIASLEAMASGRPLLLADAVALPDLVTPGENGYLFKPGDSDDAARYINLLADQRDKWEAMGKVSVEKAQYHGLENTISRYEALYEDVLKKNP
jgi:glycosyltransferase involved in cell wall biosynthesis